MTLPTDYQSYIHLSRYSRWLETEGRRETWKETVARYINFFSRKCPQISFAEFAELEGAILRLDVMPSMRCLMTAGEALERDNVAGYNCSYTALDGNKEYIHVDVPELEEPISIGLSKPVDLKSWKDFNGKSLGTVACFCPGLRFQSN